MAFPPRPGMVPPPGMVHGPPPGMPVYGMIPIPPGAPPPMVPPGGGPPRFPPNMPGQQYRPNHMQRPPPDIVAPPVAPAGSQAVTVFVGNCPYFMTNRYILILCTVVQHVKVPVIHITKTYYGAFTRKLA